MKKFNVFACLYYGTVIAGCAYLGFFLGSIIHPGMTLYTFIPALKEQMANPFSMKVTTCTPYTMAVVFLTALLYLLVQKTNKENYRFGKEHGSARWAEAAVLTKQLGDKSGYHRILSQNLRLSMNTRKTMSNNNIFCIGGSAQEKVCSSLNVTSWRCRAVLPLPIQKGNFLGAQGNT